MNLFGKDKDDNVVTLQEVLENDEKNIEEAVDLKFKIKELYNKMKDILENREKKIIEMRFGLNGSKELYLILSKASSLFKSNKFTISSLGMLFSIFI